MDSGIDPLSWFLKRFLPYGSLDLRAFNNNNITIYIWVKLVRLQMEEGMDPLKSLTKRNLKAN